MRSRHETFGFSARVAYVRSTLGSLVFSMAAASAISCVIACCHPEAALAQQSGDKKADEAETTAPAADRDPAVVQEASPLPAAAAREAEPAGATVPGPPPSKRSDMPHDLSPLGMFMAADIVVKAVMIGLLLASIATWTVWLAKTASIWLARRSVTADLRHLRSITSLAAATPIKSKAGVVPALVLEAVAETIASAGVVDHQGIKERVASRLDDVEATAARAARSGTGLLASVGATAPFIGLFGTVWGIMNSFIGISKAQTTNLAIVAPGIAEALLATAIGLVAAIPAVLFYNQLSRSISSYRALIRQASAEVLRLVSRDLDKSASGAVRPAVKVAAE